VISSCSAGTLRWWLGWRALALAALLLFGLASVAVLFTFDPAQSAFYPRCVLHQITGLHCPGCGSLRALHQLLHGHVLEALRLNPLLGLGLAVLAWLLARVLVRETLGRELPALRPRQAWLRAGVTLIALYSLLRNLPFLPFTLLAP
jgi:hypothetical protein